MEYENQRNSCSKKWKSLIQENIEKDKKIQGLALHIQKQNQSFQLYQSQQDSKQVQANTQIISVEIK